MGSETENEMFALSRAAEESSRLRKDLEAALSRCAELEREREAIARATGFVHEADGHDLGYPEVGELAQLVQDELKRRSIEILELTAERLDRGHIARARIESLETALRAGGELVGRHAPEWEDSREWLDLVAALLAPQGSPGKSGPPAGWVDTGDGGVCKERRGEAVRFVFVRDGEVEITDGDAIASAPVDVVAYQIRRRREPPEATETPGPDEGAA